jgi:hypothetical protein
MRWKGMQYLPHSRKAMWNAGRWQKHVRLLANRESGAELKDIEIQIREGYKRKKGQ